MTPNDAITRYLADLTVRALHCAESDHVSSGVPAMDQTDPAVIGVLTLPVIRLFLATLSRRGFRPKAIKGYIISLRGLIRFLHDEGVMEDVSAKIQGPRVTERRADPLTREEWQQFLAAIPGDTPAQRRDRLFFALLLETGLRLSQIRLLSLADVRLDQQLLLIRHAKNDKDRAVPLTDARTRELTDYIATIRPAFARPTSPPVLFLSGLGQPLHPCTIRDKVRLYAKRAGITRRVYPHMFRATFATRLDQAGVNLTVIQELMGHADIKTTARYVGVAGKEMREAVEKLAE